mgnify:CR=1 FL=1
MFTLSANRLVGVVGLAVGEEVVDDHADDREEEDNEGPNDLAGDRAVRLEDLNCGTHTLAQAP